MAQEKVKKSESETKNQASETEKPAPETKKPISQIETLEQESFFRDKLSLSHVFASWEYEEFSEGKRFMRDYGTLTGPRASFENLLEDGLYLGLRAEYLKGDTKYEGGITFSDGTKKPYNTGSENSILNIKSRIGFGYRPDPISVFIPNLAFNYRKLHNPDLPEEPYDYNREATYRSGSIGFIYKKQVNAAFHWEVGLDYHWWFDGVTETTLGNTNFDLLQRDGKGIEIDTSLAYQLENTNLKLSHFYRHWTVEDSGPFMVSWNQYILEPKNKTHTFGAAVSLSF